MASEVVSKLQAMVTGESKSARKKKAKAEPGGTAVPAAREQTSSEAGAAGSEHASKLNGGDSENAYVRELQKNIRNINKKLSAMQKTDAIIEANPGVSLDDLVASRKLNADQKASAEKKPGLQAQRAQLEEQFGHFQKFGQEQENKFIRERELLKKSHSTELETMRDTLKAEAVLEQKKVLKEKILTLSRFLRAAAARRQLEDDDSDLTKAFEGALLQVYGGDATAVLAAEKLIEGADEGVPSTEGVMLGVTYAQVKQAALDEAPFAAEEAWVDEVAQAQPAPPETEASEAVSDPTVTHAGLTEIDAGVAAVDGSADAQASNVPAASSIEPEAANAAAEAQWDKQAGDDPLSESFEMVPRDPAETENQHVPAAVTSTQSWADDTPEPQVSTGAAASGGDGFHEVHHNRGGRGRGGHQGEGRGGFRGRGRGGSRGEFRGGRGRGRGEFRGGRGGFRGAPRGESSS
ncbi:hypothetical protein BDU57DRAFT_514539 [Ampelomyces quisqualis]|uniref:YAG7-like dimerisation domain-containing protein n=1 Tax=Ampelomyces quisqualis TaxID=50730 RepID=A0A6A5QRK1_AMPQU|nr:hypothetical protein BDU57DRAFT_514539 [Ampelomyces quisqualis]